MNLPKLDKQVFPILFQEALTEWVEQQQIKEIYPSDTAYTLLEMQTMLVDMLNYYMESITKEEEIKFQQLIHKENLPYLINDECEQQTQVEKKIVFQFQAQQLMEIPPTHHFKARLEDEWICLENKQAITIHPNQLTAIYYSSEEGYEDISDVLRFVEGRFSIPLDTKDACLYLCFDTPFTMHKDISLYFLLDDHKRNSLDGLCIQQAKWELAYRGQNGWEVCPYEDETQGFLFSGSCSFQITNRMVKNQYFSQEGYWMRIKLVEENYDMAPIFQSIWQNVAYLYPHKTVAKSVTFTDDKDMKVRDSFDEWQVMLLQKCKHQKWEQIPYQTEACEDGTHIYPVHKSEHEAYRITLWYTPFMEIIDREILGMSTQWIDLPDILTLRLGFLYDETHLGDFICIPQYQESNGGYGCYVHKDGLCLGDGRNFLIPNKQENGLFPFDLVQNERIPNVRAKDLVIQEDGFQAVNQLMIVPQKKLLPDYVGMYCCKDMEAYTRNLPGYALRDVKVMPFAQYSGNVYDKGWLLLVCGQARRDVDNILLADIEQRLKMALPLGTKLSVQSMHYRRIQVQVKGLFYFYNKQMHKDLHDILIAKIKEHHQLKKDITTLDLQASIQESSYVLRILSTTLVCDGVRCTTLPFAYDDVYEQIDLEIEKQE